MTNVTKGRPLSPHLQIYKPIPTMVMSIVHRITGGALYFGTILVAWWLIAAASGEAYYDWVSWAFGTWIGRLFSSAIPGHSSITCSAVFATSCGTSATATRSTFRPSSPRPRRRLDRSHAGDLDHRLCRTLTGEISDGYAHTSRQGSWPRLCQGRAEHFWRQRLTAVANVPLLTFFVIFVVMYAGAPYAECVRRSPTLVAVIMGSRRHLRPHPHEARHAGDHRGLRALRRRQDPSSHAQHTFFAVLIGGLCLFAVLKIAFAG